VRDRDRGRGGGGDGEIVVEVKVEEGMERRRQMKSIIEVSNVTNGPPSIVSDTLID
jgi:hypothetical protein